MHTQNLLLRSLPSAVMHTVLKQSELVHLELREHTIEPNKPIEHVDFPETGVMSLVQQMADGSLVEVANIGYEGLTGVQVAFGVKSIGQQCFCQVEGTAIRVPIKAFRALVREYPDLLYICQRYAVTLFDQVSRNIGCNQTHSIEERCAKWLLFTDDRCHSRPFVLTQEFLSVMLAVSRTLVNAAAGSLARAGLISYVRGKVTILNRAGLEKTVCPCYAETTKFFDDVIPRGSAEELMSEP